MSSGAPMRRSLVVLASGALLGFAVCVLELTLGSHPAVDSSDALMHAAQGAAASDTPRSGVFVMTAATKPPQAVAPAAGASQATTPQEPPFPFSFLGRITEDGEPTILLYGAGRTVKVRRAGPLDERYVVDDVFDDRVIIRYLPLGTRHVVELASRQYAVPGSLLGEYPPD